MFPARPVGSVIEERDEFEGVLLSWPLPSIGSFRYLFGAFFAFATCVWVAGIFAATWQFVETRFDPGMGVWIVGWTVCGLWLPLGFWGFIRHKPETVLLGDRELTYTRGWEVTSPGVLAGLQPIFPGKPIVVSKDALELDGGRIGFPHDGKRVEIGMFLSESDRAWLSAAVEHWRG